MALVDATDGSLAAEYEYGPFGEPLKATGPAAQEQPFRFSTKYTDPESGLVYYGFRHYCAGTGRWASRDPIGEEGGIHIYRGLGNSPINVIDTRGLSDVLTNPIEATDVTGTAKLSWKEYTEWDFEQWGFSIYWKASSGPWYLDVNITMQFQCNANWAVTKPSQKERVKLKTNYPHKKDLFADKEFSIGAAGFKLNVSSKRYLKIAGFSGVEIKQAKCPKGGIGEMRRYRIPVTFVRKESANIDFPNPELKIPGGKVGIGTDIVPSLPIHKREDVLSADYAIIYVACCCRETTKDGKATQTPMGLTANDVRGGDYR